MKYTLLFISILSSLVGLAQKNVGGTVTGRLQDSSAKQELADATISVLKAEDSASVAFTLSDGKGNFEIKDLENGAYRLLITYQSYQPVSKMFTISNTQKNSTQD